MKIALAQYNPVVSDVEGNAGKVLDAIEKAHYEGADLLIFPELFLVGYPPRDLLLYQSFLEKVDEVLHCKILPSVKEVSVLLGAPRFVNETGKLHNSALLLEEGKIVFTQHKTLLPNYDVFDESRYFEPAAENQPVFLKGCHAGITVCEDVWNDKDFWSRQHYTLDPVEKLGQQNLDLMINLSASPYHWGKHRLRREMLASLAEKYGIGLIYVNQVGGNDELIFDGGSAAFSNEGNLVKAGTLFREELFCVEIDELLLGRAKEQVQGKRNERSFSFASRKSALERAATENKRESSEEGIVLLKEALLLGIRDYLAKTGFEQAVVGVSGGIDSALTVALAAEALGPPNVLGLIMPSRYTSRTSIEDALALARNNGIPSRVISIEKSFKAFFEDLADEEEKLRLDLAEENLQARLRGNLLMFVSNREGRMVLTTGNKSELAVGYCTLYGDMSGGLAVLADVPKSLVYQLSCFINEDGEGEIIPQNIIEKEPSAELKPDQVDSQSLPSYQILDEILYGYIEENASVEEVVAKGHDRGTVQKVVRMIDQAEYKRFQAPPGLKVTTRAFGSGRRMPLARGKQAGLR